MIDDRCSEFKNNVNLIAKDKFLEKICGILKERLEGKNRTLKCIDHMPTSTQKNEHVVQNVAQKKVIREDSNQQKIEKFLKKTVVQDQTQIKQEEKRENLEEIPKNARKFNVFENNVAKSTFQEKTEFENQQNSKSLPDKTVQEIVKDEMEDENQTNDSKKILLDL